MTQVQFEGRRDIYIKIYKYNNNSGKIFKETEKMKKRINFGEENIWIYVSVSLDFIRLL